MTRTAAVRALEGEAPASAGEDGEQPRATELAAQCPNAVGEMRRVLRRQGWAVPCERYAFEDDGPELMRCAPSKIFRRSALHLLSPDGCCWADADEQTRSMQLYLPVLLPALLCITYDHCS